MGGVSLPWVYLHSAMYKTYLVKWCCIGLWSIRGGERVSLHEYMCILVYMTHMQCSGVT